MYRTLGSESKPDSAPKRMKIDENRHIDIRHNREERDSQCEAEVALSKEDVYPALDKLRTCLQGYLESVRNTKYENELSQVYSIVNQVLGEIPIVVVVGVQSSGKSSVLSRLTKFLKFSTGSDEMTTTVPIEIRMIKSDQKSIVQQEYDCYMNLIGEPRNIPFSEENIFNIASGIQAAHDQHNQNSIQTTGQKTIYTGKFVFTIKHPDIDTLTVIDIPGYIEPKNNSQIEIDNARAINQIIQQHIQPPQAIILNVVDSRTDVSGVKTFGICHQHDPTFERTIHVVTKMDFKENPQDYLRKIQRNKIGGTFAFVVNKKVSGYNHDQIEDVTSEEEMQILRDRLTPELTNLSNVMIGIDSLRAKIDFVVHNIIKKNKSNLVQNCNYCQKIITQLIEKKISRVQKTCYLNRDFLKDTISNERDRIFQGSGTDEKFRVELNKHNKTFYQCLSPKWSNQVDISEPTIMNELEIMKGDNSTFMIGSKDILMDKVKQQFNLYQSSLENWLNSVLYLYINYVQSVYRSPKINEACLKAARKFEEIVTESICQKFEEKKRVSIECSS